MTQGNAFGRTGGRWMTSAKLRALANSRLTYDEIAQANERSEGWRPSRSAVKRKLEALGVPPRHTSHPDLHPWKVRPEHETDLLRKMLGAEARARQGGELSKSDQTLVARLNEMLFGRGKLMVVGYHPEVGFYLTERQDWDEDIIRHPRAPDAYYGQLPLRKELAGAKRGGDDEPQEPASSEEPLPRAAT